MPVRFQNMIQNCTTAYQVAHSYELQGRVDVDVSAEESLSVMCQWAKSSNWQHHDSGGSSCISPQHNERCEICIADDEQQLMLNASLTIKNPEKWH